MIWDAMASAASNAFLHNILIHRDEAVYCHWQLNSPLEINKGLLIYKLEERCEWEEAGLVSHLVQYTYCRCRVETMVT